MFDQLAQEPKINTRMHSSRPRQTGRDRRSFQYFSLRLRQQKTEKRKEGRKEKRAKRRKESSRKPAQQHDPRVHSNTSNVMSFEFRLFPPGQEETNPFHHGAQRSLESASNHTTTAATAATAATTTTTKTTTTTMTRRYHGAPHSSKGISSSLHLWVVCDAVRRLMSTVLSFSWFRRVSIHKSIFQKIWRQNGTTI